MQIKTWPILIILIHTQLNHGKISLLFWDIQWLQQNLIVSWHLTKEQHKNTYLVLVSFSLRMFTLNQSFSFGILRPRLLKLRVIRHFSLSVSLLTGGITSVCCHPSPHLCSHRAFASASLTVHFQWFILNNIVLTSNRPKSTAQHEVGAQYHLNTSTAPCVGTPVGDEGRGGQRAPGGVQSALFDPMGLL